MTQCGKYITLIQLLCSIHIVTVHIAIYCEYLQIFFKYGSTLTLSATVRPLADELLHSLP